jgi:hypothetical protein
MVSLHVLLHHGHSAPTMRATSGIGTSKARVPGFDEMILRNADDQCPKRSPLTLIAAIGERKVTAPVTCGLLAGICRAELLGAEPSRKRRSSAPIFRHPRSPVA